MSTSKTIVWFRQDLRISDNPALSEAAENGSIIPVYILDDENAGERKMGAASRVWLHHSLQKLNDALDGNLVLAKGDASQIIPELIKKTGANAVYWNRCYEPWRIDRDKKIKEQLEADGIEAKSFNGSLLWEPWNTLKDDGTPYKVFTPFYKKGCLNAEAPREPLSAPSSLSFEKTDSLKLDELDLLPHDREGNWDGEMVKEWTIGEDGAHARLKEFLNDGGIDDYKEGRNMPAQTNVSRLSPHLHWGEVSPNQVWYAAIGKNDPHEKNTAHFLSELGWREFSYSLLYHFPDLHWKNMQEKFDDFPWSDEDSEALEAWQNGQTGYPIVDAGMRELYATGYMHNRVRMIVGSFLVKHLLIHWHKGEAWFWNCLVDADAASNTASWQWIAGSGADAAPYFRIFNPITQGEKFDKEGEYIRKWVPELYDIPNKYLNRPWEAPDNVLEYAKVTLGETYPKPIIEHFEARDRALEAFQSIKKAA
ncbi:MAG: deoxyribodipyrimidine photo-lyase [Pseudomonadota bacterium]